MKFLFRSTLLLALLASLAYGSYAFGRYALLHYLFIDGVKANPNSVMGGDAIASRVDGGVTEGNYKGTKAQANVRVLSADDDGAGPQAPSSEALERETRTVAADGNPVTRSTPTPPSSVPQDSNRTQDDRSNQPRSGGKNDVLTGGYRGSLRPYEDDEDGSSRRRSRRRHRRRETNRDSTDTSTSPTSGSTGSSGGSASDGGSINDRPVTEEPRRTEPRRADPRSSEPRDSEPRRSEPRHDSRPPARRVPSNDSPIPVPERSGGGGDSPVPVPE